MPAGNHQGGDQTGSRAGDHHDRRSYVQGKQRPHDDVGEWPEHVLQTYSVPGWTLRERASSLRRGPRRVAVAAPSALGSRTLAILSASRSRFMVS